MHVFAGLVHRGLISKQLPKDPCCFLSYACVLLADAKMCQHSQHVADGLFMPAAMLVITSNSGQKAPTLQVRTKAPGCAGSKNELHRGDDWQGRNAVSLGDWLLQNRKDWGLQGQPGLCNICDRRIDNDKTCRAIAGGLLRLGQYAASCTLVS